MPLAGPKLLGRRGLPLLSLTALAALLLAAAFWLLPPAALRVEAGPQDRRFVLNAHEVERLGHLNGRWTTGESALQLPLPAARAPLALSLTLLNARPNGAPDPRLDLRVEGQPYASFPIARTSSGPRVYRLLLPPQDAAGWQVRLGLGGDTFSPPGDPRPLGLFFVAAQLRPAGGPGLPPSAQLLAWLALAICAYLALRGLGLPIGWAWGLGALMLALLAFGVATLPLEFAPFIPRLAAAAALGAIYGAVARLLYRSPSLTTDAPQRLTRVVLLMGTAYWLLPIFQLVMTVDGVEGVTPSPATMWVAAGALALALGGWLALWWAPTARRESWLVGVLGLAAAVHLATMVQFAFTRSGPDFWIIYKAVRDWSQQGAPLYNLAGIAENHFGHTFKVPPFYGMLFLPFVGTAGEQVLFGHRVINTILLIGTLLAWFRCYRPPLFSALGASLLLAYNMRPAADVIAFGQIDILLLVLLMVALLASQRGYDTLAGAAVAAGTLFKLYPAVLLAFFVVKGQWRALLGFVAAMLALNGIAVAVMGWEVHRTYLFEVLPLIGGGTAWVENQTLNGFLSRLAGGEMASNKFDNPLVSLATYAGFAAAVGGASLLALQPAERRSSSYMLQFAQFVVLMVLFIPAAWMHYATITIIAFVGVLLAVVERPPSAWQAALFGLAYGLVAYGNQWSFFGGVVMGPLTLLGISYKFYGLLLLTTVMVAYLLDRPVSLGIREGVAQLRRYGTSRV